MIPAVAIHLIERMIVSRHRVIEANKLGGVPHLWLLVGLGDEVISVVGIRIAGTMSRIGIAPTHWSQGIEVMLAIHHALRHFMQVIIIAQVATIEGIVLQITSIAIYLHLINIGESSLSHHLLSELMNARLAHPNLSPLATGKHGMGGIDGGIGGSRHRHILSSLSLTATQGMRLDIEHEAHQYLIAIVAEYQRRETHPEHCLLTASYHLLADAHLLGQGCPREAIVVGDVGRSHIHILRIFHFHRIEGVLICPLQRIGAHKLRQHRVYPDLRRSQVEESLCLHRDG